MATTAPRARDPSPSPTRPRFSLSLTAVNSLLYWSQALLSTDIPIVSSEIGMGFAVATCLGFSALLSIVRSLVAPVVSSSLTALSPSQSFPSLVLALTTLGGASFSSRPPTVKYR
jgi:hypothetical protein